MAFTKTPSLDTYSTKQLKIFQALDKRSENVNKDTDYLNCFIEVNQDKQLKDASYHYVKRAGISGFGDTLPSTNVRGVHYWKDQDKLYVAVDNDIVILNASSGNTITTLSNVLANSSGTVGFTEFYYGGSTSKVVVSDAINIYTIDSANTLVAAADPDLPTPHVPTPVFLDGYLFLAKYGTGDLYNSDLDDPLLWTAGNVISAEMFPDNIIEIAKLNNYLVAFGSNSIEYFWDAGNASGSPLQRNDTPVKLIGYISGFAQYGNNIFFMGNTQNGTPTIYKLEDFKIEEVADDTVRRWLEGPTAIPVYTTITSFMGHEFYVISIGSETYVMDIKTNLWTRFSYQSTGKMPLTYSVRTSTTDSNVLIYILGHNQLSRFEPLVYQDRAVNYTMHIITDKEYFDTYNQKWMSRLTVWADRPSANATLDVSWTDDDYESYNTPTSLNLRQELPAMYRLGRFRRRAFKFAFTQNYPLRIENVEVDINMGQS